MEHKIYLESNIRASVSFSYRNKFCQDIKIKEVNELWNDNCVDNRY
jgi:hypothetical protein